MEQKEILKAESLYKTFKLSKKQQNLQKTKHKVKIAVNNLSFSVYQGEILGILGPNGAGKTTTLRILATLLKPDSGNAWIDGVNVIKSPEIIRHKIGFLTSELKLEEFFTPNYLFDFFSNLHKVTPEIKEIRKKEMFEYFGINDFAEVKIKNMSTGMKQKISLVISLVHDPDIIIFDEPTNGLDLLTAKIVLDYLYELKKRGKTILLSTHIFSLVEKLCDRVGFILEGKMVLCDTLENLTKNCSLEEKFFQICENLESET